MCLIKHYEDTSMRESGGIAARTLLTEALEVDTFTPRP
jgi:hypothetical protein